MGAPGEPEGQSCFKTVSLKYSCIPMKNCTKFWKQSVKNFQRFKIKETLSRVPIGFGFWERHLTNLYRKGNFYTKFGIFKAVSFFVCRRPSFSDSGSGNFFLELKEIVICNQIFKDTGYCKTLLTILSQLLLVNFTFVCFLFKSYGRNIHTSITFLRNCPLGWTCIIYS